MIDGLNGAGALVALSCPKDLETISRLRTTSPDCVLVALLEDSCPTSYLEAFKAGASAAVPLQAEPELIVKVLRGALEGYSLLPLCVTRALTTTSPPPAPKAPSLTAQDVKRLQLLAGGGTVVDLARGAGYSEREMFRLLHQLYRRMGVENRSEALVKAAQWGLLQP